jgi:hypothetical protein
MSTNNTIWGSISVAEKKINDLESLANAIRALSEEQRQELFVRLGMANPQFVSGEMNGTTITAFLGLSALPLDKDAMAAVLKTLADILSRSSSSLSP